MVADGILTVRGGIDVRGRTAELGLDAPETYAILPFNLDAAESAEELMAVDQTDVLRRMVFDDVAIEEDPIDAGRPLTQLSQQWGEHLYLPTIHFTEELVETRREAVLAMIERVEDYYTTQAAELDVPEDTTVEIAFNLETDGTAHQFVFEDHPSRLGRVIDLIEAELGA